VAASWYDLSRKLISDARAKQIDIASLMARDLLHKFKHLIAYACIRNIRLLFRDTVHRAYLSYAAY
jgi:hypothetical protein